MLSIMLSFFAKNPLNLRKNAENHRKIGKIEIYPQICLTFSKKSRLTMLSEGMLIKRKTCNAYIIESFHPVQLKFE